ncbi:MAG: dienelactone hydrolase family protein [Pseudomonadales bacterium]|nr:dienelactone hydrolase family protein [Pseudomonadales bacterium]
MAYLPCEIIETQTGPEAKIDAAVIWLHGLGATGHDFVPIVPELKLPAQMGVRFVFPHAPSIPVTINGGMSMPAWYDILAMDIERKIDDQQIMASSDAIKALIEREISHGIKSERIVLAGFSQGGAVVYQTALSYNKPLAGLMAMSTYFATFKTLVPSAANKNLPIHVFHGTQDQMVPEAMGKKAMEVLELLGHKPSYKNYPMGHEVHPQEIKDISSWLQQVLA